MIRPKSNTKKGKMQTRLSARRSVGRTPGACHWSGLQCYTDAGRRDPVPSRKVFTQKGTVPHEIVRSRTERPGPGRAAGQSARRRVHLPRIPRLEGQNRDPVFRPRRQRHGAHAGVAAKSPARRHSPRRPCRARHRRPERTHSGPTSRDRVTRETGGLKRHPLLTQRLNNLKGFRKKSIT